MIIQADACLLVFLLESTLLFASVYNSLETTIQEQE